MRSLADNREYLMEKSSLINFIERYRSIKMNHTKLKELWKSVDKSDFDKNEQEVFLWFQEYRKSCVK